MQCHGKRNRNIQAVFKGFEDNYVIIGGTACEIHEDLYAQVPRATKDIDIILIVEALSAEFVAKFWEFVKMGNYEQRNKGVNENVEPKHEYFRFMKPANPAFPYQVELFSRSLGLMNFLRRLVLHRFQWMKTFQVYRQYSWMKTIIVSR